MEMLSPIKAKPNVQQNLIIGTVLEQLQQLQALLINNTQPINNVQNITSHKLHWCKSSAENICDEAN